MAAAVALAVEELVAAAVVAAVAIAVAMGESVVAAVVAVVAVVGGCDGCLL